MRCRRREKRLFPFSFYARVHFFQKKLGDIPTSYYGWGDASPPFSRFRRPCLFFTFLFLYNLSKNCKKIVSFFWTFIARLQSLLTFHEKQSISIVLTTVHHLCFPCLPGIRKLMRNFVFQCTFKIQFKFLCTLLS